MKTVLVVPKNWTDKIKRQKKRLKKIQPFSLCAHDFLNIQGAKQSKHKTEIANINSEFELALWVLPKNMASGKSVKYWPRVCEEKK